jgi:ABC-2 type transport system ATP-binding protein
MEETSSNSTPSLVNEPNPDQPHLAIQINGLIKHFGSMRALNQLSFDVPYGTIAGFVGPNGAGKTTTLRIISTLLKQDRGSCKVLGHDVRSERGAALIRKKIGFMPDYFGLYTDMTCREYLDFFGAAYHIPGDQREQLIDDILPLVNLNDKKDTMISGLSRGMQQKLSLGRCLIHSPDLLLLDEPASGLDPRARIELLELLKELKNMGKTIFISSHILTELQNICDGVVIIERGEGIFSGDVNTASQNVMQGRNLFEVIIQHELDQAIGKLQQLPGVLEVKQENATTLIVELDDQTDSNTLIRACVSQDIRIEEIKRGSANLEEIFMQLTKG